MKSHPKATYWKSARRSTGRRSGGMTLKGFCVLAILSMIAVPVFADSDDNLASICKAINCSEAPGLPMSRGIHELGKSPIYRLQATISDGVDTDRLNTTFKDPYNRSDSGYKLETIMYGREIVWQDWLDAEGPQRKFHEVEDRIIRGPGWGQPRIAIEPQETSDDRRWCPAFPSPEHSA